jgi:hypothetical protein
MQRASGLVFAIGITLSSGTQSCAVQTASNDPTPTSTSETTGHVESSLLCSSPYIDYNFISGGTPSSVGFYGSGWQTGSQVYVGLYETNCPVGESGDQCWSEYARNTRVVEYLNLVTPSMRLRYGREYVSGTITGCPSYGGAFLAAWQNLPNGQCGWVYSDVFNLPPCIQ